MTMNITYFYHVTFKRAQSCQLARFSWAFSDVGFWVMLN